MDDHDRIDLVCAASSNGCMESDIHFSYMSRALNPVLGEEKSVLLVYDGHNTRVDYRLVNFIHKNDAHQNVLFSLKALLLANIRANAVSR